MTNAQAEQIEQEIQAKSLKEQRITLADIEANIVRTHFFTAADGVAGYHPAIHSLIEGASYKALTNWDELRGKVDASVHPSLRLLTFCVLVLRNGFTVTGESTCASQENFDAEVERKIAHRNAVAKIWPLMGYELRTKLRAKE